jgi:hypothetical protein
MMHGRGKSDTAIVAWKPANKADLSAAESVEPRAETKGNADQQSTRRAQDRASVSQALEGIRQVAEQREKERFTSLLHHIGIELLRLSYFELKKNAAAGVDGLTWRDYEADLEHISKVCTNGSSEERIERCRAGDSIYRSRTEDSAQSRLPHLKTRSSRERPPRC